MFFTERAEDAPAVVVPSSLTAVAIATVAVTVILGRASAIRVGLGRQGLHVHQIGCDRCHTWRSWPIPACAMVCGAGCSVWKPGSLRRSRGLSVRHADLSAPRRGRRQTLPALMTLLCAAFGDPDRDAVYDAATVVELTHLATLYHDDVMDEAPIRRGRVSANQRWDNSVAILTGDFLFSRASDILADLGPRRSGSSARVRAVGDRADPRPGATDGEDAVAHHLMVLADKTGSLIATSAQFARCSPDATSHDRHLTRYGERIGVAFHSRTTWST